QADEQREIVGHDRRPHVGLEVVETAPRAAGQAVGPLQAGDASLDPGAEVAQLAINPAAAYHVGDLEPALFLWKAMSDTPHAFARLRLSRLAKPPSATAWRGAAPYTAMWRSSIGISRSLSAGLPASITRSSTRPLRPVVRLSL